MENVSNTTPKSVVPRADEIENIETEKYGINDVDEAGIPLDPETRRREKKLKWKLDLFILPLVSLVYFFASMVRTMSPLT
jgi:hypothetical protein